MSESNYLLLGREIESPLVCGEGAINGVNKEEILNRVDMLARTGIGAITIGSITVHPREGNEFHYGYPAYYYDQGKRLTYNSLGFPNIGVEAAVELLPEIVRRAHHYGKPLIVSVSSVLGDPFEQNEILVSHMLRTPVDGIIVNTSCPNIVTEEGGRKELLGLDYDGMVHVVSDLERQAISSGKKIGLKLPPYISMEERKIAYKLGELFRESSVLDFIVASNSIPNQIPRNLQGSPILKVPEGLSGMSGPDTKGEGRSQLELWANILSGSKEIISMLGVDSGEELYYRTQHGANAAGIVTLLMESRNWGNTVSDVLKDFVKFEE